MDKLAGKWNFHRTFLLTVHLFSFAYDKIETDGKSSKIFQNQLFPSVRERYLNGITKFSVPRVKYTAVGKYDAPAAP